LANLTTAKDPAPSSFCKNRLVRGRGEAGLLLRRREKGEGSKGKLKRRGEERKGKLIAERKGKTVTRHFRGIGREGRKGNLKEER
jgi:hypothetical protein